MSEDPKVRDLIKRRELPDRRPLGARLAERLGARMWERPNVCFSGRLYKRFGLADPWDPTGPREDPDPVALGPVAVRLGQKRRQPAPHLRPKAPKKKKKKVVDPVAKYRRPQPKPKAVPEPAPAPRPTTAPAPAPPGAPPQVEGPAGRAVPLPVRPDLAALQARKGGAPPPRPARVPPAKPPPARVPGPPGGGGPPGPGQRGGMRPPMPPRATPRRQAGRMRARAVRAPKPDLRAPPPPEVVEIAPPAPAADVPVVVEAPPAPAPAPAPPPRRTAPTGPVGLDDLFGMGQQEGRMRMRRRKKKEEPEGE